MKNTYNPSRIVAPMLAVAALSALLSPALLPAQISLGTAVNLAQRNSSAVKLAQADLNKTYAVLAQSKDVFIPNLVIGSDIGPPTIGFPTGQPSIANASMQSLAFSFSQGQYIKAARAGVDAATLTLKDAKEQVALDASTAYIELDTVNRELAAARDQSGFSDRLVAIEQQRSDAGVDSVSELLQARLTAAELRLKMIHLESRARTLASQIATLAGLPVASISADHASIPEIPAVKADEPGTLTAGIEAARAQARSKQLQAHGDWIATRIRPVIDFGAQYNLDSDALNHYSQYFNHFTPNNFSAGFLITIPLFDKSRQARAKESAADALRATVEAEQAQRQNDIQIATLTGSLRELDTLAEIATLKQQISAEQLRAVESQLQYGNGSGSEPGASPQLSPKAEQLARIDQSQRFIDAIDAGFDLAKARLSLLRALGHMNEWLHLLPVPAPSPAPTPGNHP